VFASVAPSLLVRTVADGSVVLKPVVCESTNDDGTTTYAQI